MHQQLNILSNRKLYNMLCLYTFQQYLNTNTWWKLYRTLVIVLCHYISLVAGLLLTRE